MAAGTTGDAPCSVDVGLLLRAARSAPAPDGPARWFARPVVDGLEFRAVVKDWVDAPVEAARETRVACGAAFGAARLALLMQGRAPIVAHPRRPGLLATLVAGGVVVPGPAERAWHAAARDGNPAGAGAARRDVLRAALRRAADTRHAWFRTVPARRPADLLAMGRPWGDVAAPGDRGVVAVVGAPAVDRIADLRVGETVGHLRLVAVSLGWDVRVLAGPVHRGHARRLGAGMPDGSLVLLRVVPTASSPPS